VIGTWFDGADLSVGHPIAPCLTTPGLPRARARRTQIGRPVSRRTHAGSASRLRRRVSTDKQGRSGLGLEAQQAALRDYLLQKGDRLLQPPYVEVESGRSAARPKLVAALARCRTTGATLLVAKRRKR
jgi:Resolvase, N terminal domain